MDRSAKIVATVGPASSDRRMLQRLLRAGVDVVRLNVSHGDRDQHRAVIQRLRRLDRELGRFTAIIVDLMGPRYRLGEVAEGVVLRRGQRVTLGSRTGAGKSADLDLDSSILKYVKEGERILIDNGLVEIEVLEKRRGLLEARVLSGGPVSTRKGINLPDSKLPFSVSAKDREDIAMAVEEDADYLAASYVGSARDVAAVREVIEEMGGAIPIIAKLERGRAVAHLDEIVSASDAVMVARGDLGVEIPLHQVPVIQKRIVESGLHQAKPVIVATQMLESMMEHPRPTRAESSDVANAVFDGADALMLSGETAAGRYPVEVVRTMDKIIREAEGHQRQRSGELLAVRGRSYAVGPFDLEVAAEGGNQGIAETIAAAAVLSAKQLGARRIVALTQGGYTVRRVSSHRPSTPVIALTRDPATARRSQLVWGARPLSLGEEVMHHDEVVRRVDQLLLEGRLASPGEQVAILMGDPIEERPPTNLLRLHRVRAE
ncbi:MAG TPA: pyruvate kinase [Thermoanaerobaculia bacterium]|nr:pyruvate kinase [Thermoanaerobaculia bacterium]